MTTSKVTAFPALTAAGDDDVLYVIDDPGGTPVSKKITAGNLRTSMLGNASAVTTLAESGGVSLADGTQITLANFRTSLYAGLAVGLDGGLAQIAIGRVGSLAGVDNTGDYQVAIGRSAGQDNTGDMQVAIGRAAGYHNTGDYCTQVGYYAGYLNEGESCTHVGYQAGRKNTADRQTALGYNAGLENTGARQTCVGEDAGIKNVGSNQTCIGENAGAYNRGNQQVAMGEEAGQCNLGLDCVAIGRHAMRANAGNRCTAIGNDTFDTFLPITASAKTFNNENVSVANQTITITGHGFGATDAYVNLLFTAAGAGVPGMDDGEVCLFKIVDANTLLFNHPQNTITAAGADDGHTLTPVTAYNNATAVGYAAQPDASNQVMLGDTNVTTVKSAGAFVSTLGHYGGALVIDQGAPAAIADGDTAITAANVLTRILTMASSTAPRAPTVPTGTAMNAVVAVGRCVDWTFINTGDQTVTITQAANHTLVGTMTIAAGASASFRTRVSATNTAITYRL